MIWIKRNYKVVLLTVLFSTLASLFFPLNVHPGFVENDSIATAVSAFFFIDSNEDLPLSITISAMMFVPLIPLLGVFKRDYVTELWYCITRYRSRKSWFFKKTGSVLFLSFVSTAVYFLTVSAVVISKGVLSFGFFGKSVSLFLWFFALRFFFHRFFCSAFERCFNRGEASLYCCNRRDSRFGQRNGFRCGVEAWAFKFD